MRPVLHTEGKSLISFIYFDYITLKLDDLGSVSQSRFSENPGFINPEMRETLGFPFHKGR